MWSSVRRGGSLSLLKIGRGRNLVGMTINTFESLSLLKIGRGRNQRSPYMYSLVSLSLLKIGRGRNLVVQK